MLARIINVSNTEIIVSKLIWIGRNNLLKKNVTENNKLQFVVLCVNDKEQKLNLAQLAELIFDTNDTYLQSFISYYLISLSLITS